jgi:hypothetical protein
VKRGSLAGFAVGQGVLRLASLISLVLHPFLVAPLGIVLILWIDLGDLRGAMGWAALCAALVVVPALAYLRRNVRRRAYTDADVSVREQRYGFYLFGGICMALCYVALLWLQAPAVLLAGFSAALLAVAVTSLANRFWTKVSIHTGVVVGVAAMVAYDSLSVALLLAVVAVVLTWARLVTGRHTLTEALAAWAIPIACVVTMLGPWRR